ncbi:hypothetical protein [Glaciimonas soli]|uniref:Uncharacterized protein n=1 Tax=Glaciimonas soli TaxID=2590999 RepID=A0A843YVW0_9BURK|nr:hypothetical protein [Glaciimonas soli]MQR02117.1 hypothetical protein [Glaciimonas soli]
MKLAIDDVMLVLLSQGTPIPLGFPHWALFEFTTRKDCPMDPEILLGLKDNEDQSSMLNRYEDLQGYQFTWGVVSEDYSHYEEDPENVRKCKFEISPEAVLKTFLQSAMLQDLYAFMYEHHPDYDGRFECDEAFGDLYTMSFSATGNPIEHAELRGWMANTFIPLILPDLNAEAARIVGAEKLKALSSSLDGTSDKALIEVRRYQLCPHPSELTFVKRFLTELKGELDGLNGQDPDD